MAYELYWDCALLCEKAGTADTHAATCSPRAPTSTGAGTADMPTCRPSRPLTPIYTDVSPTPPWDYMPAGWFTRYGAVADLVTKRDDRLVLLDGGDELALSFDAAKLPPPAPGMTRDFFLHVVGWDKDADFHVGQGWQLEPLPFQGMDDPGFTGTNSGPAGSTIPGSRRTTPAGSARSW